jgi:hypothetical protein
MAGQDRPMNDTRIDDARPAGLAGLAAWLRTPVTVTLPGWAVAAGAVAVAALLLVALD